MEPRPSGSQSGDASSQSSGTAESPGAGRKRRILIVDDNVDNARTLGMLLKLTGNETHLAYDGEQAVQAAETVRPDVVLLDIGLPKMSGHEACKWIRGQEWGKSMVLIALTGWSQDEDHQRSADAGFNAHMVKPIQHQELTRMLTELAPV